MSTTVEKLENNQVKLGFEVEAKEVDFRINKTYKEFAKRYKFPGFRPGKAPRPVIDNMLGADAVRASVTEDVVNEYYCKALEENNLCPLFQAQYDYETDMVEQGNPYKFSATITVKPELELSSYEPLEVEIPSTDATEREIDLQVEEFRGYYSDFVDADPETEVKPDDFVEFTMTVTDENGEQVPNMTAEKRLYELGANLFPAAFDAELVGMKAGEEKSFDVEFAEGNSMMSSTLEKPGVMHFEFKLDAVKEKSLPEVTDEWAQNSFGFADIAEMRANFADSIKQQKEFQFPRRKENECLYAIGQRITDEVPEGMCDIEEAKLLETFYNQLQQSGLTLDTYLATTGTSSEQFKADVKEQAKDLVKQDLALDAWARHYNIEVSEEEVIEEFNKADIDDPMDVYQEWLESGRIPMIREGIARTNALNEIVAGATVIEIEADADEKKVAEQAAKKVAEEAEEPAEAPAEEQPEEQETNAEPEAAAEEQAE